MAENQTNINEASVDTDTSVTFESFVGTHKSQLLSLGIPNLFWHSLFTKLNEERFDAGGNFMMHRLEGGDWEVLALKIDSSNPDCVFLIDHAWTYEIPFARDQLMQHGNLFIRMLNLMEIDHRDVIEPNTQLVDRILDRMWQYNQTYSFSHETEDEPLWYVMDEFGSRIQHNSDPNVKIGPFHFAKNKTVYSVLWPLRDIDDKEEVVRDYAYGATDPIMRQIKLMPWYQPTLTELTHSLDEFAAAYDEDIMLRIDTPLKSQPYEDLKAIYKTDYTVFTDIVLISDTLTLENFTFVDDKDKADILWVSDHYRKFDELTPESHILFINQFPFEDLYTCKHFMSTLIISHGKFDANDIYTRGYSWLPLTFELNYDLKLFVRCFLKRQEMGLKNIWILKPVNKARGIDTHVTDDLDKIIRHTESVPKLACLYISDPMLFYRPGIGKVKIDIRYVILLTNTDPLELYIHDIFWLRFSNKKFSLDQFDDYEKHFTVMNYKPESDLKTILSPEFIKLFEEQYPELKWAPIEDEICAMLKEAFSIFFTSSIMSKVKKCERSKAVYATDLMLEWCNEFDANEQPTRVPRPRLLEINFCPDTVRACQFVPQFYNDVFSLLFLSKTDGLPFRRI